MGEEIKVDVSDAIKGLDNLDKKVAKSYVRKSLRAAAKVTLPVAKSTAPEASGVLRRNVKIRSAGVKKGNYRMVVGIGKKWFSGPAFYGAFVAFGHRIGKRQLGADRKLVPGNDWLEKAYEQTKNGAVEAFSTTIAELIESKAD